MKVKLKNCPVERVAELRIPPELEVMLWGAEPLFVHTTFVPTLIFKIGGLNAKFFISTVTFAGVGVVVGVGFVEIGELFISEEFVGTIVKLLFEIM